MRKFEKKYLEDDINWSKRVSGVLVKSVNFYNVAFWCSMVCFFIPHDL